MNKLMINAKPNLSSRQKEVYRMLRTNIEFTGVENRVIAVTSCAPNDGKSTVAYHLAQAMAEAGKKTLLVDGDLRKSVLLSRLQIETSVKGLSHLLSGQEAIGEVMYSTNTANFYMLPSGIFPTNPTELLGNKRFKELIQALRNSFDYVIIDTPPVGSVIDAAVIARESDGTVIILASDKNPRGEAKYAVDQIRVANPNILGVVLNKAQMSRSSYYGKRYRGYYAVADQKS